MPFVPNKRFVGREEKLKELEKRLLIDKDVDRLAIVGLGGIGKTQLARAFCHIVKTHYSDFSIYWVSAVSNAAFKQDYMNIAQLCSISFLPNEVDTLHAVRNYLSSTTVGNWLMVIDNADDKNLFHDEDKGIIDYLPRSETGLILFTTRHKEMADIANHNIILLEEMNATEAELFLKKLLGDDPFEDKAVTKELLEELTHLPLAIVQAASYMVKTSISISKYLTLMRTRENEMVELLSQDFHDSTRERESLNAVAKTWLVSFNQIKKDEPSAAEILFFLSFLENKAIPLSILPSIESNVEMTRAVGILVGYSFLSKQGDDEVYDMHRLVHRAVKIWMQKEQIVEEWREKVVAHLKNIFPSPEWENRSLWQKYMPHTIRVLQDSEQSGTQQRSNLCLKLGLCLEEDGRISEAIRWTSEATSWTEKWLPEDSKGRLHALHNLAYVYLSNRQVKEAIPLLERVVEIQARVLTEDDGFRLTSQNVLAEAYNSNGQTKQAIEILEKVVAIRTRVFAEDHPSRLSSQHKLAQAYESNGQIKEAVELLEKVVGIQARVLAEDHPDRLVSQHELARAYMSSNGRIEKAVSLLENVVEIQARVLAEDHPSRLASQHELARAYMSSEGRIKEAVELLEKVVEIEAGVLAEDHPERLASQHVLARAYQSDGQLARAISLMQHVVTVQKISLPIDDPLKLDSEAELSEMLDQQTD